MQGKISVIVPAHNEEQHIAQNISVIISTLYGLGITYEIIVIDDCSDDDTYLATDKVSRERGVVIYRKVKQQGKGAAIKTGWKMATGEYCLVIDADLQIKPIEIKTFIKLLDLYDADVVIGNKRHCYSNVEYPLRRRIVSYCYNLMNRIIFGISLRDTQCGFKLFKKSALDMVMDKVLVKRFAFDLEVMVALHDNKVRIVDAPVYVEKSTSAGSVNAENIFNTLKDTLAVFVRRQKGWYK